MPVKIPDGWRIPPGAIPLAVGVYRCPWGNLPPGVSKVGDDLYRGILLYAKVGENPAIRIQFGSHPSYYTWADLATPIDPRWHALLEARRLWARYQEEHPVLEREGG